MPLRLSVPAARVRALNARPVRAQREYVLYWMTANRRTRANHALQRAVEMSLALRRPLLVLEALRCDYPWASQRLHTFVVQGMADNARACQRAGVRSLAYIEPHPGAGAGLVAALARRAAIVVSDDAPGFFLPRMAAAAAAQVDVRLEAVDAAGLLPVRQAGRAYPSAATFRRYLQRSLAVALADAPVQAPLAALAGMPVASFDDRLLAGWPLAHPESDLGRLCRLPIDRSVAPVAGTGGGSVAGQQRLREFVQGRLLHYGQPPCGPEHDGTSGLSPYLHFGHLGAHEVLREVAAAFEWTPERLGRPTGAREGWWGLPAPAEAFLDQLAVWRELGYGFCTYTDDVSSLRALPRWAALTLERHASDPRPRLYALEDLEAARTHDAVWNAAQRQLVEQGTIHNALRMVWGKKVLEWSPHPELALAWLIHLNNRYALDGRDPNSATGILWCLGAFDRPWAPERPVFGTVRYMSSARARRKHGLDTYLRRFGPRPAQAELVLS